MLKKMPDGWCEAFGKRVRAARLRRNLTQMEVAGAIGTTRSLVTMVEGGKQGVLVPKIVPLARVLGLSLEELLGDKP